MSLKINMSQKEYEECTELLDKRAKRSGKMEIRRALFSKLVLDNSIMYDKLKDLHIKMEEKK